MITTTGRSDHIYTEDDIADKLVTDEEYECYMLSDNCDLPIEEVEFFLPEFSE